MKILKYLSHLILWSLILVIVLAIFSQTPIFKGWLSTRISETLTTELPGTYRIGKITGNLFGYIELENIYVEVEGDTAIFVEGILLHYRPMALAARTLEFHQVRIDRPSIFLWQSADSSFNLSKLVPPAETETDTSGTGETAFSIMADRILLREGSILLRDSMAADLGLPTSIHDITLDLGLSLDKSHTQIKLRDVSFETTNPALNLSQAIADVELGADTLQISGAQIRTDHSQVRSNFGLNTADPVAVALQLNANPISLEEVRRFMPELDFSGEPVLELDLKGPLSRLEAKVQLLWGKLNLSLEGRFGVQDPPFDYDLKGKIVNLDLNELILSDMISTDLNLDFQVKGSGTEWGQILANLVVETQESVIDSYVVAPSRVVCDVRHDSAKVDVNFVTTGGEFLTQALVVTDLKHYSYRAFSRIRNADVRLLAGTKDFSTDLNLDLRLRGSGITYDTMVGDLSIEFLHSQINEIPLDSADISFSMKDGMFEIDDFNLYSPFVNLFADGDLSIESHNDVRVEADFKDFSVLSTIFPADSIRGAGRLVGSLAGTPDSLYYIVTLNLSKTGSGGMEIDSTTISSEGIYTSGALTALLNAHSTRINLEAMSLDSTNLTVDYHDSVAAFDVFVQLSDSLSVGTKGNVEISQNLYRVLVDSLNLRFLDQMWRKEGPPALISIDDSGYGFEPLTLHSRGQTIGISGLINDMGESDFAIDISDIKLSDYERWFGEEAGVDGTLFINFKLQGTFARPELECQIVAKQGTYYDVSFDTFDGTFGYADENFTWGFYLAKTQSDSALESSARLPMSLSLAPFATEIYADKEMEFKISTQGIEVAFLQQFFPGVKNVQGTLVADIVVRNTLNDMHGVGPIRIINGQLDIPEFGMKFRKANIVLLLREQELLISGFKVESGGGTFKVTEGSLSLSQGNVQNFTAKFRADNFRLINNKMMNARVSGDVGLSGSVQSPSFTGELTFTEANIFYEEWLEEATPVTLTSLPFFVITDEPVTTDSNGAIRFQKTAAQFEEEFTESALFKSLSGELALYFPRNVWVKGSDTNIEVEGELVAVKEVDSDIVLFGSFSVMRGYYEILGNPFHITEGELVFTGDPEHNPEVAFTATRKLVDREQGNNHELTVKIAGTLFYPEFEYRLDNQATSELEVAYILLWGKPLAEANQPTAGANGQPQEEGKLGLGKRATGFLEGQLLNQISNQLGQKLSLDVIEIKKGKSITEASVRVGKYITRDVYLSVSQDVDGGARTVEMEYDLPISKVKYLRFLSEYINLLLQTSVQDKSDEKDQGAFDILGKIEW